jgi:Uma2 family endonuclease
MAAASSPAARAAAGRRGKTGGKTGGERISWPPFYHYAAGKASGRNRQVFTWGLLEVTAFSGRIKLPDNVCQWSVQNMDTTTTFEATYQLPPTLQGAPSWPVALLYPLQGHWTEDEYLSLQERCNRLIELCNGQIEVLPMANLRHQRIVSYLSRILEACVLAARLGEVVFAPLPIRLGPGKYRDPDIVFLKLGRVTEPDRQPEGADLVIEVVSPGEENRKHDYETKRKDYSEAGIAEYWIVDPMAEMITLLVLDGAAYRVHGECRIGTIATSVLLPIFSVSVSDVFAAGQGS